MKQFRQGDVFLLEVTDLPTDAIEQNTPEKIVLAYGEVTGHTHAVSSRDARLFVSNDKRFLKVKELALLVHEEHSPILLNRGTYRVVQQREYTPQFGSAYVTD